MLSAAFLSSLLALAPAAQAAEVAPAFAGSPQGVGLGLVLGEPSGISWALRHDDRGAIQGSVAWALGHGYINLTGDYLLNVVILDTPELPNARFPVYVGIGGEAGVGEGWGGLGVRVPVGISLLPRKVRLDAFLELVPVVQIIPATGVYGDAGIGGRFYF